jgi:nicotinate phosphoribosyltransferase
MAHQEARQLGLATDLYQLTMAAAYYAKRREERAVFELFIRRLPPERSYLVIAGLEQALAYLRNLSFSSEEIEYLRGLPVFAQVKEGFFDYLHDFSFNGNVWAMPEGTIAFAGEPLLRVEASLIEAQIIETFLLATINFQTSIATKGARIVESAQGRGIIEFGARRCHGFGAAIYAARAAFIGGCIGTSNVEAGRMFDIPVYGTAAHSFIMAFDREIEAFRAYHEVFPESTTLLLDTYDTVAAAHLATEFGPQLRGVRLDSGDMVELSKQVRAILDGAGMQETKIMASGDLEEYKIAKMLEAGAPIDMFGVGTELSTSRDVPALGGVYKLVELEEGGSIKPKMKLSSDKATYPCSKQVWRLLTEDGKFAGDVIGTAHETKREGKTLLIAVMQNGKIINSLPRLIEIRDFAREQLACLPSRFKKNENADVYPVRYSTELEGRRLELLKEIIDS